jgi:hypothetical protein
MRRAETAWPAGPQVLAPGARVAGASGLLRMQGFITDAEAMSPGGNEVSFGGSGLFQACSAALPTNPGPK